MDQIVRMAVPERVIIPMEQHRGVVCEPLVKVGDKVSMGRKIGESKERAATVHASISGEVEDVVMHPHPYGREVKSVIIRGDGNPVGETECRPQEKLAPSALRALIRESGVIEYYGLGPPARIEKADTVILSGNDFHPHISVDKARMIRESEKVIKGLSVLMRAVEAERGFICINAGDKDTTRVMKHALRDRPDIFLVSVKLVYARGMGLLLQHAVRRKSGISLGKVLISTVPKAKSSHDAAFAGKPRIENLVSVTGVNRPMNLAVRIGVLFKDVIDYCGGYTGDPRRIIMNSPMTGLAQYTDEVPVIKGTYGIMVQYDIGRESHIRCIRCAKCVDVCPVNLVPNMIALYAENNRFSECRTFNVASCVECGYCAFECPSRIPILQLIRYAKGNLENGGGQ